MTAVGELHVRYRRTAEVGDGEVRGALALLSADELVRHDRLRTERDRREFAIAHALLRTTLSAFAAVDPREWQFSTGPHGKPEIARAQAPLAFNLSHTDGLVACAVALAPARVGLDVELATRAGHWRGVAARFFSEAERALIDRAPAPDQPARFVELWTLKEAFAKALGSGLWPSLGAVTFTVEDGACTACTLPAGLRAADWQFALHRPAPDHRLAVAVSDGSARLWRIEVRDAAADR